MLCPRCGSKIVKGKICEVCGYELEEEIIQKFKMSDIFLLIPTLYFLFYGYHLLKSGNILLTLMALFVLLLVCPILRNKIKILYKLNKIVKRVIIIIAFFLVTMYGNDAKIQNNINDFISKYSLQDEFSEMGIDDIQSIKITHQYNHPSYPSVDFQLTNEKEMTYTGLMTGDKEGNYKLLSFSRYDDGISKDYYAADFKYDFDGRLTIDLYDYKTDELKQKKETNKE